MPVSKLLLYFINFRNRYKLKRKYRKFSESWFLSSHKISRRSSKKIERIFFQRRPSLEFFTTWREQVALPISKTTVTKERRRKKRITRRVFVSRDSSSLGGFENRFRDFRPRQGENRWTGAERERGEKSRVT